MQKFDVGTILEKTDLLALVEQAGVHLTKSGSDFRGPCALHGGNNPNGFSVYSANGIDMWKCLSGDCGGGDAIEFVQKWQGMSFVDSCKFLHGDVISDPVEVHRLADIRHEAAKKATEEARMKEEARRVELQKAKLHLFYHDNMKDWAREMWVKRGISEDFQNLWSLGSCDDKVIMHEGKEFHTPSLTIPILDCQMNLLNIKHRLVNPPNPSDKYRPERDGLGAMPPFLAYPEQGYDGNTVFVCEGEVKSMVVASISYDAENQYIGVPGKSNFKRLAELLKGKNVIIIPDPDAYEEAVQFCKTTGARMLRLVGKVDDMIVEHGYDGSWLKSVSSQARRV